MFVKSLSIKKIKSYVLIQIFICTISFADTINKIQIDGNNRVSKETVILFSKLNIGDKIKSSNLNSALKELYDTNYFKDVSIRSKDGVVYIKVDENPIIQSVIINGVDKNRINDALREVTIKLEKYPFVENQIIDQVNLIKNILKSNGYYFVKISTSISENNNNTVDLVYDVNLGEIAKIKKITFIGNQIYRDSTLRNVVISEESKFWKFLTPNKFLDTERIKADVFRLNSFYKNRGYFDAEVKSATALINDENQFELIFNINAGEKFMFNDVILSNNFITDNNNIQNFKKKLNSLKGKKYSAKVIQNYIDELNEYILQNEFIFINAKYEHVIKPDNKINIVVKFDELEKEFVERINIKGNFLTDEKVVRNKLIIDEGDAYNDILFNKSIQKVKASNIFKTVKYETKETDNLNKIIDIIVEEKATGEIFAGAGTGSDGSSINAGIKENNYLGLGIKLDTDLTLSNDSIAGKFSVTNPNFKNSDKSIKTVLESSVNDFMSTSGYKTERTGFSVGTEFEQKNNLFVNLELSNYYEDLETSSSANSILKKQQGNYIENLITYTITYNNLDQDYQPTDGFLNKFSQTLPIYSDDLTLENNLISSAYTSLNDNLILSASLYLKAINSLDDNVRVSKRAFIPSRRLRGFEPGKIGPKDGNQYIGGNYASALNLNTTLPNVLFENDNVDLNFFVDLANVWEVDYNSSLDSNKIRSSTGIAMNWFSAIGPLSFSYAIPLSDQVTDKTQNFRFQIGTSF